MVSSRNASLNLSLVGGNPLRAIYRLALCKILWFSSLYDDKQLFRVFEKKLCHFLHEIILPLLISIFFFCINGEIYTCRLSSSYFERTLTMNSPLRWTAGSQFISISLSAVMLDEVHKKNNGRWASFIWLSPSIQLVGSTIIGRRMLSHARRLEPHCDGALAKCHGPLSSSRDANYAGTRVFNSSGI